MVADISKKDKEIPDWARQIVQQHLDQSKRRENVLRLSVNGISVARSHVAVLEALAKLDELEDEDKLKEHKRRIEMAKMDGEFAQKEVDSGFPILFEQSLIAVWGALEVLARNLVAHLLFHIPELKQKEAVRKIKVKIGDYETLDPLERCLWIVDLLDQELSAPLKAGINRFESLLEPFGLGGSVSKEAGKKLFELSRIRNLLVHKNGIADRQFVEACPWLGYKVGDVVTVNKQSWDKYQSAHYEYVLEIIQRLRVYFGLERYVAKDVQHHTKQKEAPLKRRRRKASRSISEPKF